MSCLKWCDCRYMFQVVPMFLVCMMSVTWFMLVALWVTTVHTQTVVVIDCEADAVTITWRPELNLTEKLDPSKAHLGTCPPLSPPLNEDMLQFSVWLHDCGFRRWVSGDKVTYTNMLTYELGPGLPPIVKRVQCSYDIFGKMPDLKMRRDRVFHMDFMNSDFSGPATSTMFTLGSRIPIRAEVVQQLDLLPVQIYLQSCVLAKTLDLSHARQLHTLISNAGCLTESKDGNSTFLPRRKPSEISFYFQAFKFALYEPIFLHCDMAAWDGQSFSADKKACHYLQDQKRWQLLDDPDQSYICSCCDTTCSHRTSLKPGISTRKVLGPFTVVDSVDGATDKYSFRQGLGGVPVWIIVLTVFLVLVLMTGAISMVYYMCFWRGGRLGYRPSRDLLNKY